MGDQKAAGREEEMQGRVVCVTGASGYIATWLVRTLLQRGCVVHATVRNLGSEKKTEVLRGLPGAAERLALFEADMYDAATFEPAIAGCEFVFLVATPLLHDATSTKYKDTTEAAVDAHRIILQQCERSGTVRRVIHTGSVMAASPLREDGDGYKEFVDESCWTPLHLSCGRSNAYLDDYVSSKTLSEKSPLPPPTAPIRRPAGRSTSSSWSAPSSEGTLSCRTSPTTTASTSCCRLSPASSLTTPRSSSCRSSSGPSRWCTSTTPARRTSSAWTPPPSPPAGTSATPGTRTCRTSSSTTLASTRSSSW